MKKMMHSKSKTRNLAMGPPVARTRGLSDLTETFGKLIEELHDLPLIK
jgi:hypothetical protein